MTATGDGWLAALRHGDWLDGERTRVYVATGQRPALMVFKAAA